MKFLFSKVTQSRTNTFVEVFVSVEEWLLRSTSLPACRTLRQAGTRLSSLFCLQVGSIG